MARNPEIETYRGTLPRCTGCGKPLRPVYQTEKDYRGTVDRKGQAAGWRWAECTGQVPDNPDQVQYDDDDIFGKIKWDPRRQSWMRREGVTKTLSRKFTGRFGCEGNGFFCSKECGFLWAVKVMRLKREAAGR